MDTEVSTNYPASDDVPIGPLSQNVGYMIWNPGNQSKNVKP